MAEITSGKQDQTRAALAQSRAARRELRVIAVPGKPTRSRPLDRALTHLVSRSPEEVAEARERALQKYLPDRPLPRGKTFAEVLSGRWPGDGTNEQIVAALDELS